jgi:ribosomal protein S16
MPVRIRLARFGRRNLPFYRIFVADSRCPRDGRHLEVVGHFDPIPGECSSCTEGDRLFPDSTACRCSQGRQQARRAELRTHTVRAQLV